MRNFYLIVIFLITIIVKCYSQDLILNGDFEDVNICSEHNAPCSPEGWRLTSTLIPEYKIDQNNHSVGFVITNTSVKNIRSYLQTRLATKLTKEQKYKIELEIMPGKAFISKLGIIFSDSIILTDLDNLLKMNPDIEIQNSKGLLENKNGKNWLKFEREFTAKSENEYIIIGSFESDENAILKYKKNMYKEFSNYYYFIDNVSLIPIQTTLSIDSFQNAKEKIYAQNYRHPVPNDFLNNLQPYNFVPDTIISNRLQETDTSVIFGNMLFDFDSYTLSKPIIEKVDSVFNSNQFDLDSIKLVGYTDKIGTDEYNDKLSYHRAQTIADYIISKKYIDKDRIRIIGLGSRFPIDKSDNKDVLYKNRRVEIIKYFSIRIQN